MRHKRPPGITATGYQCISCQLGHTSVYNSRQNEDGFVRRNRECPLCGFRFATIEIPIDKPRTSSEYEQFKLARRTIFPKLVALADAIDLLSAEHE